MKFGKGDDGFTDLLGGMRVRKDDQYIDLIGEMDELSAWIGVVRSVVHDAATKEMLQNVQEHLSMIMAKISMGHQEKYIDSAAVDSSLQTVEQWIRLLEKETTLPRTFIQPGEKRDGSLMNMLRVVTRRVERRAIATLSSGEQAHSSVTVYLNRLSTLFYLLWLKIEHST